MSKTKSAWGWWDVQNNGTEFYANRKISKVVIDTELIDDTGNYVKEEDAPLCIGKPLIPTRDEFLSEALGQDTFIPSVKIDGKVKLFSTRDIITLED